MYKLYTVGWCVRDRLLWLTPKDIDYVVVFDNQENYTEQEAFNILVKDVESKWKVYVTHPEFLTLRWQLNGVDADFVIARKEEYSPESRLPVTKLWTLEDDLRRRDFTINAIASDMKWNIIDMFSGEKHIVAWIIRATVDEKKSLWDDPLRILRAIRFAVVLDFRIDWPLKQAIMRFSVDDFKKKVHLNRALVEFQKAWQHSKNSTIEMLLRLANLNPDIYAYIVDNIGFIPTLKQ